MNGDAAPPPKSLQSVIGAMLFAAEAPLSPEELHGALRAAAQGAAPGSPEAAFAEATPREIRAYLEDIAATLGRGDLGLRLCEEGGRFAFRTAPEAGPWVRALQPISRAEIESVRGVSADHTVRALLEQGLIRAVGRSELPGRPFLYGTTATFLEHFGLRSLADLEPPPEEP